jgi:hypothetical protein
VTRREMTGVRSSVPEAASPPLPSHPRRAWQFGRQVDGGEVQVVVARGDATEGHVRNGQK